MTAISRRPVGRASWIVLAALACGGGATTPRSEGAAPVTVRLIPAAQAIVLENAGPPPPDTSVVFPAGQLRTIVLRHGPPENVDFAELTFPPTAFADSGRPVEVTIKPRQGLYGVDIRISEPLRERAFLVFRYGRYFLAPERARTVYGGDVLYERALSIGQVQPDGRLALLPSTRPASDNLRAALTGGGGYLVVAPQ